MIAMNPAANDLNRVPWHPGTLTFWVPGRPQTAGSKVALPAGKGGKTVIVESGGTEARRRKRTWRADVREACLEEMSLDERGPWPRWVALEALFLFVRPRPASHLRTGRRAGEPKEWAADVRPMTQPDLLKNARAAEDALKGVAFADDAQIAVEFLWRCYGDQAGLTVFSEGTMVRLQPVSEHYDGPLVPAV